MGRPVLVRYTKNPASFEVLPEQKRRVKICETIEVSSSPSPYEGSTARGVFAGF
jgi:hypothetical protein